MKQYTYRVTSIEFGQRIDAEYATLGKAEKAAFAAAKRMASGGAVYLFDGEREGAWDFPAREENGQWCDWGGCCPDGYAAGEDGFPIISRRNSGGAA